MPSRIVRVSLRLDGHVQIALMALYVTLQSPYELFVIPFRLVVCMRVVRCRSDMFSTEVAT